MSKKVLYKSTITIYSDYDPDITSTEYLVRDAMQGDAYFHSADSEEITGDALASTLATDPDMDEFFFGWDTEEETA